MRVRTYVCVRMCVPNCMCVRTYVCVRMCVHMYECTYVYECVYCKKKNQQEAHRQVENVLRESTIIVGVGVAG